MLTSKTTCLEPKWSRKVSLDSKTTWLEPTWFQNLLTAFNKGNNLMAADKTVENPLSMTEAEGGGCSKEQNRAISTLERAPFQKEEKKRVCDPLTFLLLAGAEYFRTARS